MESPMAPCPASGWFPRSRRTSRRPSVEASKPRRRRGEMKRSGRRRWCSGPAMAGSSPPGRWPMLIPAGTRRGTRPAPADSREWKVRSRRAWTPICWCHEGRRSSTSCFRVCSATSWQGARRWSGTTRSSVSPRAVIFSASRAAPHSPLSARPAGPIWKLTCAPGSGHCPRSRSPTSAPILGLVTTTDRGRVTGVRIARRAAGGAEDTLGRRPGRRRDRARRPHPSLAGGDRL